MFWVKPEGVTHGAKLWPVRANSYNHYRQLPGAQVEGTEHRYALHTQARHEKVVEHRLRERGVETFLLLVTEIHRWSDR